MRITILGATGNMGRRVIAEALSRGHDVMGVARNREGLSKLPSSVDAQIGDANRIDDVIKLSTGQDVVINTMRPSPGSENTITRRSLMKLNFTNLVCLILAMSAFVINPAGAASAPQQISDVMSYESHNIKILGSNMHYVEGGKSNGQVFLFLHGNPSSSYLWRNVMPYLEPLGRVIAVDLVGFGKSDKPDIDYTFQDHSKYVDAFIDEMKLKNINLVIHDWGSVLGLEYARTHSRNVKSISMMEAIVPPKFPAAGYEQFGPAADVFRGFRHPETGHKMIVEQNMFIEEFLIKGTVTREMNETEKSVYRAPFLDPKDRKPILLWPNELPIEGIPARNVMVIEKIGEWLKKSRIPKLLLYATPGAIISPEVATWMQENYRNLQAVYIGTGAHYIQEDQPESIGRNIFSWHQRTFK